MKRCPNNHDNPDSAKFCRICGFGFDNSFSSLLKNRLSSAAFRLTNYLRQLIGIFKNATPPTSGRSQGRTSVFTPDMFPSIDLTPCSVASVNFNCKKGVISLLVLGGFFIALWCCKGLIIDLIRINIGFSFRLIKIGIMILLALVLVLFFLRLVPFLKRIFKWIRYKMNVDYIESKQFVNNLYRIAKKGRVGLFDKSTNKILMRCQYSNITKFDANNILIEKNGRYGLFSVNKNRLIVPIVYDHIDPFRSSIVKCNRGTYIFHYDINGNKLV